MIGTPGRIAVFRALHLGDLLVAVPALRALRALYPAAEITLIGLPWAAGFAARFDRYIDRFLLFPGYPGIEEQGTDPAGVEQFLAEQRRYGYDLALQLHGSGETSNPFVLSLGARRTAGFYHGDPPAGLDPAAPYPDGEPEVIRCLRLIELLGAVHPDPRLEFSLTAQDRAEAAEILAELPLGRGPLIGVHPGSKIPTRRWPAEYFAAAADELAARYDARVVLTGGPGEEAIAQAVAERLERPPLVAAGRTSLGGLAALIARLDLFLANDTGPAHIAEAVGTRSVTVIGPTEFRRWAALDQARHPIVRRPVACSPCMHWECPIDHRCLRGVKPQMVVEAVAGLLREVAA